MIEDGVGDGCSVVQVIKDYYVSDIIDEFIFFIRIGVGAIVFGDGVIFYNFCFDWVR